RAATVPQHHSARRHVRPLVHGRLLRAVHHPRHRLRPLGPPEVASEVGSPLPGRFSIALWVMDVTPRELRDTDIREGFRGYHRDDVDELLERAASTIEGLTERVRQLTERVSSTEGNTGRNRETEEMLQRTLILAQKTADEAIAEAQERSRTLLEESEQKARSLVTD